MDLMEKITSLCKRRGFIYPGSEIYGGLANTYDYGPLGVELLRNIKNLWWDAFVTKRDEIYGLHTNILMSPKVWEASGHVASFTDVQIDCRECQYRTRADHLIEDYLGSHGEERKVEGYSPEKMGQLIDKDKIVCPKCGKFSWTKPRMFNNLFETHIGIISGEKNLVYLRGEIAQGMFVNFKNVLDSLSPKLPFGLAQSGAAFRNEITLGKLTFRSLQFNLSEFEYFFNPEVQKWEEVFEYWKNQMWEWTTKILGINEKYLHWRPHTDEERSHYSKRTEDIDYNFPWGFKELYGLAYRTDFDLKNHMEKSGVDLRYTDPESGKKFIPHVVEPTFGMDRSLLAVLFNGYYEDIDKKRVVLKIVPKLASYKVAIFPLLANKEELVKKAKAIYGLLATYYNCAWDDRGNIGKRYFSQDEIGTPWCVTVDFKTLEDDTVTVRDRDTAKQERVSVDKLDEYIENKLLG
ncbi:glycine--tRNA ligase [Candidatus Woesebacteria bacterium RBG_13_36_22]|uniref:glycine--tRNA ligase n=1 Tax=Candidatus Woesebacteria bacterium RBG_13_36_22 TaxID=1802478 RepID=A0A1F7X5V8_9BACT|nr:MAG: glycine--tRNA ligase [Candidatus Woesebacteria bacterium RBG_13_36_22]